MSFLGLGQSPDSPVTGTAAWLASACAILAKDATFAPILDDPYAQHFAAAISERAPALLAAFDDEPTRSAFIAEQERLRPGSLSVVAYRKPLIQRLVQHSLAGTAVRELIILGVGCDTLSLRLARAGITPTVYEVDRSAVIEFRARVMRDLPLQRGNIRGVGVDFERQTFGQALLDSGYDASSASVFVAEGLLGYLQPNAVDELFRFIRLRSAPGSRFVFSFTENRRSDAIHRVAGSEALIAQGEPPKFDLSPAEVEDFVETRGFKLLELITATELEGAYRGRHGDRIRILPFLHFAVVGT